MDNVMSEGLGLMGVGIGAVFGLMALISFWIWGMGKVVVFFESKAKARKKALEGK